MNQSQKTLSLWLVLFIAFMDVMGIGLVYPMFSSMLFSPEADLLAPEISNAARSWYLGMLLAAMPIAQFFSATVLGALSDQKGRKWVYLLSMMVGIVGYLISVAGVFAKSITLLVASRVMCGIAAGNEAVVGATIADLSTKETKAKNFGYFSLANGVGFMVGPFLGGMLSTFSYALPFVMAACATTANLGLVLLFFRETHQTRATAKLCWDDGLRNLKKAFYIPGLRVLFLSAFFACFAWSFFYEFIPVTWIADYNLDPAGVGFFYAYGAGIFAIASAWLVRPFVSRFGHYGVLFYSLMLMAAVILLLLIGHSLTWVWVYMALVNFLVALYYPTYQATVSDFAGNDAQGEVMGIAMSIQAAAFGLSPLAAGSLLGNNPHMPLLMGGLSMALAGIVLGVFLRKQIFRRHRKGGY